MNKKYFTFLIGLFLSFFLSSCSGIKKNNREDNQIVLVSFTILADIVKNIAGDQFIVQSITKPGVEVHGYQTSPRDLVKGSKAKLFIENGFGFELWSQKFVSNLDIKTVTVSNNLSPIYISEDAYSGKPNPHAWVSPKRGILYVDFIEKTLSELKPESKSIFKKNAEIYKNKILKLDKEFTLFVNSLDDKNKFLVSCEGAFSYLTYDYGMNELYLWPVNAESQITPRRMANVINTVKENNIPAVFCESTVNSESQLALARTTGAKFGGNLFVDSLSTKNGPADTYLNLLSHNLELIKKGLQSSISKK